MNRTVSSSTRLIHALLALTFFWAVGTDAYGAEACPHHEPVSGHVEHRSEEQAHSADLPAKRHVGDRSAPAHDHSAPTHGEAGPCTCITHCQAPTGDISLAPAAVPSVSEVAPRVGDHLIAPRLVLFGPRHHLFELHLPNAPPSFLL